MKLQRFCTDSIGGKLLFFATFLVFRLSPVHQVYDSNYSMLLSEHLLRNRNFTFERQTFPSLPKTETLVGGASPTYQLEQVRGRLYYWYPPGSSLLSIPYVATVNAIGVSTMNADGTYNPKGEAMMQSRLAPLLMAGLVVITFYTSRLLLPFSWSSLIAWATALGTQVWSTASRGMWTDTWGIFILSLCLWMLLRAEIRQIRLRPLLLATCLSWMYFVRPTFSIPIIAITLYVCLYHRSILIPYALTGCVWLAIFIGYSEYHFGHILPNYYQTNWLSFGQFPEAFAGNLFSPSRGLLVYVPVVVFIVYLLLRYGRQAVMPRFIALSFGVIVVHLIIISGIAPWHAGHCYGPRYSTGLVPWLALLGIFAVHTRLQWRDTKRRKDSYFRWRVEWSLGACMLLASIIFNGAGGLSRRAMAWNFLPVNVDEKPERVWDWKDPQFFRPFQAGTFASSSHQ